MRMNLMVPYYKTSDLIFRFMINLVCYELIRLFFKNFTQYSISMIRYFRNHFFMMLENFYRYLECCMIFSSLSLFTILINDLLIQIFFDDFEGTLNILNIFNLTVKKLPKITYYSPYLTLY